MIRTLPGRTPAIDPACFVHEAAEVIGEVAIAARASVWPTAVVRADTERVSIGAASNIQDGAVLHADPGFPCLIGAEVTVGHRACVHGCTIEDGSLIGIGAIILNGARVGTGSIVGAGAVVPEGMKIPPGSMVIGVPAKVRRETTDGEKAGLREQAQRYVVNAALHAALPEPS